MRDYYEQKNNLRPRLKVKPLDIVIISFDSMYVSQIIRIISRRSGLPN